MADNIITIIIQILKLIQFALVLRILLSWLPTINWYAQPFKILMDVTDPILEPFRRIVPPIGGMLDISPMIPLLLIQMLIAFVTNMATVAF